MWLTFGPNTAPTDLNIYIIFRTISSLMNCLVLPRRWKFEHILLFLILLLPMGPCWIRLNSTCQIDHTRSKSTATFLRRLPVFVASLKVQPLAHYGLLYINDLSTVLGDSDFLFCRWCENGVPAIPIKPPSLLSLFRLGPDGEMGPTNQPQKCSCLTVGNLPPLSPSFSSADTAPQIPQVTDVRDLEVPLDTTFTASSQCEYSKAITVHGPKLLLVTIQKNVYFALQCLSAATSRVYNRSQRPTTEDWYKPAGEVLTPCNTASERSSSRSIWGKASPTQPLVAVTQTPPSWPHPGLHNFQRWSWPQPVWHLPPPTPSRATRAHLPITARTKPSSTQERCLFSSGREILEQSVDTPSLVTQYLSSKQFDRQWPEVFSCSTCVAIHWHFSLYCYPRLFMFSLTPNPRLVYVVASLPFLPLINRIKISKKYFVYTNLRHVGKKAWMEM